MQISPPSLIEADDPLRSDCPGRSLFDTITNRWSLLILLALRPGPLRFHVLRDRVEGISERMLSQNLKALRRDGLVERTVEPSVPPKTSYALTPIGMELDGVLEGVTTWIARRLPEVLAARERYDESG